MGCIASGPDANLYDSVTTGDGTTVHSIRDISTKQSDDMVKQHYVTQLPPKFTSVQLNCSWKDQGWGNQKGQLYLTLSRQGKEVAKHSCFGVAGHSWAQKTAMLDSTQLGAQAGDTLGVAYSVGGGGGHELYVRSLRLYIHCGVVSMFNIKAISNSSSTETMHVHHVLGPVPTNAEEVFVKCQWKDQGWGNQKGRLYLKPDPKRGNEYHDIFGTHAPHNWQTAKATVSMSELNMLPGDSLSLCYKVGGGGGHALYAKDIVVIFKGAKEAAGAQNVEEAIPVAIAVPVAVPGAMPVASAVEVGEDGNPIVGAGCPKCGADVNKAEIKFCPNCGASLH